jgi:single-strand DNA-binding protein
MDLIDAVLVVVIVLASISWMDKKRRNREREMNNVQVMGRLGGAPQLKQVSNDTAMATFSVALTDTYKDANGAKQQRVDWVRVVCFGRTAENCAMHLDKGCRAIVEGRLQTRQWTDNDGNDKSVTEILADRITFVDWKSNERPE